MARQGKGIKIASSRSTPSNRHSVTENLKVFIKVSKLLTRVHNMTEEDTSFCELPATSFCHS